MCESDAFKATTTTKEEMQLRNLQKKTQKQKKKRFKLKADMKTELAKSIILGVSICHIWVCMWVCQMGLPDIKSRITESGEFKQIAIRQSWILNDKMMV